MNFTFKELTRKNYHHRGQHILIGIEVPELGITVRRTDAHSTYIVMYRNDRFVKRIPIESNSADEFRKVVRRFVEENYAQ